MTRSWINPYYCFVLFLTLHLLGWTFLPFYIRDNLPLDAIEGTLWGHQLEWGYDKNPYLNAWLTALATHLGGQSGWMIYLFSQLSVTICFWAVWRLGTQLFSPWYALIAVLLLESMQYYNFHAIDFNDNTLELGLWALFAYYFYQSLSQPKKYFNWIASGLIAGLALMAKYYTASLLVALFLLLLSDKNHRKLLTTRFPYITLFAFLAVTLPHFIWLFFHDFITIKYVFARTSTMPHWTNHFFFPLQFTWQQLQVVLPTLLIYFSLFLGKPSIAIKQETITTFQQRFLYFVGLGPLVLTFLLSLCLGIKLRAGWGMPLLSFSTLLLLSFRQPHLSPRKITIFVIGMFLLLITLLLGYSGSLLFSKDQSSANFPGKEIAEKFTHLWRETYHTPLTYVAGSRWVGGNISFYSPDHPSVFIEWNKTRAPWIDVNKIKKHGAIFVWDLTNNKENLPIEIKQAYPTLGPEKIIHFDWHRNVYGLKPVRIGMAILPPHST